MAHAYFQILYFLNPTSSDVTLFQDKETSRNGGTYMGHFHKTDPITEQKLSKYVMYLYSMKLVIYSDNVLNMDHLLKLEQ